MGLYPTKKLQQVKEIFTQKPENNPTLTQTSFVISGRQSESPVPAPYRDPDGKSYFGKCTTGHNRDFDRERRKYGEIQLQRSLRSKLVEFSTLLPSTADEPQSSLRTPGEDGVGK